MQSPSIDLHLGTHKTASTHFQAYLNKHHAILSKNKIEFHSPGKIRRNFINNLEEIGLETFFPKYKLKFYPLNFIMSHNAKRFIKKIRDTENIERHIFSDENMLGKCDEIINSRTIYPSSKHRLMRMKKCLWTEPTNIYLSIRNFYTYVPSAYSETVRHRSFLPYSDYVANLDLNELSWIPLIHDIKSVFPKSKIVVWQYESYQLKLKEILIEMFGEEIGELLKAIDLQKRVRISLGSNGIKFLAGFSKTYTNWEMRKLRPKVIEIFARNSQHVPFNPWPELKKPLSDLYENDLQNIPQIPNVRLL